MNIVDPILFHSRHDPAALALCVPDLDLVNYGRLGQSISQVASRARDVGLRPGHVVALFVPQNPVLHAVLILGLARVGVITASVTARKLPKSVLFDAILSDGPHPHSDIKSIPVDQSWVAGDSKAFEIDYVPNENDICRIILTSGTTGESKAVALTHRMILGRIMRFHLFCGNKFASSARLFCDVTLATALGYTLFIYMLVKGGAFFMRGNVGEDALAAFDFYRLDSLVAHPRSLPGLLAEYEKRGCHHVFDVMLTVGGILSTHVAERVATRMGSNVIACYGSTETGLVANAPAHDIRNVQGAVGHVHPGMTVEIVDDTNRRLPFGENGVVRIRGEHVVNSYFNEPASDDVFCNGWFYPGDVGSLSEKRLLTISGRKQAVLNLGGEKIAAEAIEEIVAAFDSGITAGAALVTVHGGGEQIHVAIESNTLIDDARLKDHCQKHLSSMFMPNRFVLVDRLPRNEMGKLDRDRLHQMLRPI